MSDRSESPDILELDASPPSRRSISPSKVEDATPAAKRQRTVASQTEQTAFASPRKSIVIHTPSRGTAGSSPWRIKVTVEAQPDDRRTSASTHATTTMVPLKGPDGTSNMGLAPRQTSKRRKGTPTAKGLDSVEHVVDELSDHDASEDPSSIQKLSSKKRKRGPRKLLPTPKAAPSRTQRLSHARDDLDHAIRIAVGENGSSSRKEPRDATFQDVGEPRTLGNGRWLKNDSQTGLDPETQDDVERNGLSQINHEERGIPPGDLTITENEAGEFSMVSVESLRSNRPNGISQRRERSDKSTNLKNVPRKSGKGVGENSRLSVSYLPSSPPGADVPMTHSNSSGLSHEHRRDNHVQPREVPQVGNVSQAAHQSSMVGQDSANETILQNEERKMSNWRERARARKKEAEVRKAGTQARSTITFEPMPARQPDTADIWYEEASREDAGLQQPGIQYQDHRSPQHLDLIPDDLERPRRSKLPKTWRERDGDDVGLVYSDSPDHISSRKLQARVQIPRPTISAEVRVSSTSGSESSNPGSEVLTPPSNEEQDEHVQSSPSQQTSSEEEFGQPDAEATRLQNHFAPPEPHSLNREAEAANAEESGLFWHQQKRPQSLLPQWQVRPKRTDPTEDLAQLLGLSSSPAPPMKPRTSDAAKAAIESIMAKAAIHQTSPTAAASKSKPNSDIAASHTTPNMSRSAALSNIGAEISLQRNSTLYQRPGRDRTDSGLDVSQEDDSLISKASHELQLLREMDAEQTQPQDGQFDRYNANGPDILTIRNQKTHGSANQQSSYALVQFSSGSGMADKGVGEDETDEENDRDYLPEEHESEEEVSDTEDESEQSYLSEELERDEHPSNTRDKSTDDYAFQEHFAGQVRFSSRDGMTNAGVGEEAETDDEDDLDYLPEGFSSEEAGDDTEDESVQDYLSEELEGLREDDEPGYRSYEEHLNKDSPQKVRVNFGSSTGSCSSILAPPSEDKRSDQNSSQMFAEGNSSSLEDAHRTVESITDGRLAAAKSTTASDSAPGLLWRVWSALTAPAPAPLPDTQVLQQPFSPSLRIQLRGRYGVLAEVQPWKWMHMRTLHRMHNSATEPKADSLIPRKGRLPLIISKYIGGKFPGNATDEVFSTQHGYIVFAFFQVLVPARVTESMRRQEIAYLGDETAKVFRELWEGHHGDSVLWSKDREPVGMGIGERHGHLTLDFVVRALGLVISAQRKHEKEEEERHRLERSGWERWIQRCRYLESKEKKKLARMEIEKKRRQNQHLRFVSSKRK